MRLSHKRNLKLKKDKSGRKKKWKLKSKSQSFIHDQCWMYIDNSVLDVQMY